MNLLNFVPSGAQSVGCVKRTVRYVEIKGIAREAGYRTKIAVNSLDPRVDSVGACVGVQGSRIKSIVDELNGEKIDIVRWSDQMDGLIANTLKPAEIESINLNADRRHALVIVPEDQLSLAIGKRGQNVRLAAKLTGWDIDIKPSAAPKAETPEAAEPPKTEVAAPAEAAEEPKTEVAAPAEAAEELKAETAAPPEAAEEPKLSPYRRRPWKSRRRRALLRRRPLSRRRSPLPRRRVSPQAQHRTRRPYRRPPNRRYGTRCECMSWRRS